MERPEPKPPPKMDFSNNTQRIVENSNTIPEITKSVSNAVQDETMGTITQSSPDRHGSDIKIQTGKSDLRGRDLRGRDPLEEIQYYELFFNFRSSSKS
jgi:hypothetical protein